MTDNGGMRDPKFVEERSQNVCLRDGVQSIKFAWAVAAAETQEVGNDDLGTAGKLFDHLRPRCRTARYPVQQNQWLTAAHPAISKPRL